MPRSYEPFDVFLTTVSRATNETQMREAFIALAGSAYGETTLATDLALSAEYQVRFRAAGVVRRGVIDSFFSNLIIEFEHNLGRTRVHALEQLRAYVAGAWTADGSSERPYLAVASDGLTWEIYTPNLADPEGPPILENIELSLSEQWPAVGTLRTSEDLHDFLNRLFFRKDLLAPTAGNFARDFGLSSPAFLAGHTDLLRKLAELADHPRRDVLQDAWHRSLQISYGSIDTDDSLFAKHTYLAVLARLLVFAAMERRPLRTSEVEDVVEGSYFVGRRIANLVENDYFHWYSIPSKTDANRLWVALSRQLAGYDLAAVKEDVLKPLYEQLVDPSFRHDLGEYYTPDWLAERVVSRLLKSWDVSTTEFPATVDPSCGSGTFLRAIIQEIRTRTDVKDRRLLEGLLDHVMGIDVHPLAVTTARATYLLAIKDLVPLARRPITVPVYLANSLLVPALEPQDTLFGQRVPLDVDQQQFPVPSSFVYSAHDFDTAIDDVLSVARAFGSRDTDLDDAPSSFRTRIGTRLNHYFDQGELISTLGAMSRHIAQLIRDDRDTVYAFMLKNHYRPAILRHRFDYVVGNPPWLTVADIKAPDYKELVLRLNEHYQVAPRAAGQQAHTEIATIFFVHFVHHFLKEQAATAKERIALVMPRSLFSASHHSRFREGEHRAFLNIEEVWDLKGVTPVFSVPSCVVFGAVRRHRRAEAKRAVLFSGRLPSRDGSWDQLCSFISEKPVRLGVRFLGKRSAWVELGTGDTAQVAPTQSRAPYYRAAFRQGAVLYPQMLVIVEPIGMNARGSGPVQVRTPLGVRDGAKVLSSVRLNRTVDGENLYSTAAAEHLLPFTVSPHLWVALLPTVCDPGDPNFAPVSPGQLRAHGRVDTAAWLEWAEKQFGRIRKKDSNTPLWERLDHLGQFSAQASRSPHIVLYTSSGKRPVASVIATNTTPFPFVARDKTYWANCSTVEEADYLVAFLNSDLAADRIRDWMTRGLFGTRDVHKRVLDLELPRFTPESRAHAEIAELGAELRTQAADLRDQLPAMSLGRQRTWLRGRLAENNRLRVEELLRELLD